MPPWIQEQGDHVLLAVVVSPRAARTRVVGVHDGRLKLQVASPPTDGQANDALVRFIAETLDVARAQVDVVGGHGNRRKTVRVARVSPHRVMLKLSPIEG